MTKHVLIRAELVEGLDPDGNAKVLIGYSPETDIQHGRLRFIDPAAIVGEVTDDGLALKGELFHKPEAA